MSTSPALLRNLVSCAFSAIPIFPLCQFTEFCYNKNIVNFFQNYFYAYYTYLVIFILMLVNEELNWKWTWKWEFHWRNREIPMENPYKHSTTVLCDNLYHYQRCTSKVLKSNKLDQYPHLFPRERLTWSPWKGVARGCSQWKSLTKQSTSHFSKM